MTGAGPLLGVSSCLLGESVRYDGGHKRHLYLVDGLAPHVRWLPVCPEVEMGLGAPRPPIQLHETAGGVRLVCPETGEDLTARMASFAGERADALRAAGLHGFIFKSRSPSCGVGDAPVVDASGLEQARLSGAFVTRVQERWPELALITEDALAHERKREVFLVRVYAAWRFEPVRDADSLAAFHRAHRWLLQSRADVSIGGLDEAVARSDGEGYRERLGAALAGEATTASHERVLLLATASVEGVVAPEASARAREAIDQFVLGRESLAVALAVVRELLSRIDPEATAVDAYLSPPPPLEGTYARL